MPIFVFGFMLIFMGVARVAMKGDDFGFPDIGFVVFSALGMALVAYFRPRSFS